MTAYERRRRAGRRRHEKRMRKKAKGKWSIGRKIGLIFSVLIVTLLCGAVAYMASKWGKVETKQVRAEDLSINHDIEHETGFLNVALFGLDSRDDDMGVGNRSDTMMVASLNKETGEIKLVSVYRDTLLELGDGSYSKANAAYSFGDAEAAIGLLNRNLDLDVEKYVACTFKALVDTIDAVGGITIDVKEEEIDYLNGYQVEIIKCTGIDSRGIRKPGKQLLNGTQATAYARIRYTDGGDFTRTKRQREVLSKLGKKLRNCNVRELNKIVDKVFPEVKTNFKLTEVLSYIPKVSHYAIGSTMGFPKTSSFTNLEGIGSCVIAEDFADDVTRVHRFLYGKNCGYTASSKINSIASRILEYKAKGSESNGYDNEYDQSYTDSTTQQQTTPTYENPYGNTTDTQGQTGYPYGTGTGTDTTGTGTGTGTNTTGTGTDTTGTGADLTGNNAAGAGGTGGVTTTGTQ